MTVLRGLFDSFLPFENPIGFGAADFLELALAAWLVAVFLLHPYAEPWLRRLASRPLMCLVLLAMAPVALRLALLPLHPVPRPEVADEFRMLAAAGNLRHFRWSSPAHPMAAFFEPAPDPATPAAIPIAIGQMVGEPWVGVVLSMAALIAACYWMLCGWTSPGWALAGGVLAVCAFGPLGAWMNGFRGGAVAALGGCLALGAVPRLARPPRWRAAVILAAGIALVLLTQLFQPLAAVAVLLLCTVGLQWMARRGRAGAEAALLLVSFIVLHFLVWYGVHLLEGREGANPIRQFDRSGIDRPDPERRAAIDRQLADAPGRQLVIVLYWPGHRKWDEWVYNESDPDAAPVVRARDLGAAENERL